MAIEIREETSVRMYIGPGRRAGFHGGQFLWDDEPVMCALPSRSPFLFPSARFFFFFLLSSDNDRERYIELHAPFNREQYPGVSRFEKKKKVTSAPSELQRDPLLLAFVNAVQMKSFAGPRRQYISLTIS